jgi:hypothetical protein
MAVKVKFDVTRYMTFDRKKVRAAMRKAAQVLRKDIRQSASRRGVRGSYSAPGSPPYRQSGNLYDSIYGRASRRGYAVVAGTLAPHAHLLELGTVNMQARPLVPPSTERRRDEILALLREAIGDGLTAVNGAVGRAPQKVETG